MQGTVLGARNKMSKAAVPHRDHLFFMSKTNVSSLSLLIGLQCLSSRRTNICCYCWAFRFFPVYHTPLRWTTTFLALSLPPSFLSSLLFPPLPPPPLLEIKTLGLLNSRQWLYHCHPKPLWWIFMHISLRSISKFPSLKEELSDQKWCIF